MIEFFNFVVEVFFWMMLGWFMLQILGSMLSRHVDNKLEQLNAEIAEIERVYKRVKIEEHNDTFYLFNADTDEFIGQGRTMQEIAERVRDEVILNVMEGDPDVIQRFKQTVPKTDLA